MPKYNIKENGLHHKFQLSRNKVQIIGGGFGNGKTAAVCIKALSLAQAYPGSTGLIAMASYSQLNDTIRAEFYKWVPHGFVKRWPSVNDNTIIFKNNSRINFRYIKQKGKAAATDGQTSSNLLSATYDYIIIDQVENPEILYKDFNDVLGRLRGSTMYVGHDETMPKTGPRWLMLTANPSYNWVWHKLIKPMKTFLDHGRITKELMVWPHSSKPMIDLFEGSTYENRDNLPEDFILGLEAAYTGQFRDRYIEGIWGAYEGLVYPSFDSKYHVLPKHEIMNYVYSLGHRGLKPVALEAFDFGIAKPSCYLFGFTDHIGRIFVLDGFYAPGLSITQIGTGILEIQSMYCGVISIEKAIRADPAIFKRTVVSDKTLAIGKEADTVKSLICSNFDINMRPGQNNIINGIAKVNSYLSVKTFPHYETGIRNGCLIYFASHLDFVFDEFNSYFWKMGKDNERTDEPSDRNDHAMDDLKYMTSWLPEANELFMQAAQYYRNDVQWMMSQLQN